MSQDQRRLAAIMFTDMVGYTALGQRNEALSLALVDEQRKLIRPLLTRHNGREVKTIGDAFLVEFPSAVDAVRCAYDIQRAAREFGLSVSPESRIRLRVGVHLGEVVESQGDISGDAVNVASRIEPLAEEGGVCVTRPVYEQVRGKVDLPLVSIGARTLKNVAEPMEVFRMSMPWDQGPAAQAPVVLNPRRIAVLPFVSLSPDPNDEYFADGLTEELITKVSFVKGLEVIARTSAMNYKRKEKNVSEIGKELKVGTLLEGSVRKAGNRIRVTAQLIDANNEAHLWAESYDKNLDDVFEVQSSVAENVASALQLKLVGAGAKEEQKVDPQAYTMYLQAVQLTNTGGEHSLRRARALLESAIAIDPGFARAYAALARVLWYLGSSSPDYAAMMEKARAAGTKALELAPGSDDAHVAMAYVHSAYDQFEAVSEDLREAVRINPNNALAFEMLGSNHLTFGRYEEGVTALRKSVSLDPLSIYCLGKLASGLRISGKVDEAIVIFDKMRREHPDAAAGYVGGAVCLVQKGDYEGALTFIEKASEVGPGESMLDAYRGWILALQGKRAEAEAVLASFPATKLNQRRNASILIYFALGDLDAAGDVLLEQAKEHAWYPYIWSDPLFRGGLKTPKGAEFCRMVGLPPPE
ncbi:MAG: hypothetical protein JRN27_06195 [Nitrososphaerota archaeon]|nr:hypothetical protein [Nitrososphaerota archaeon]